MASQTIFGFFKESKGFGEYLGWYLCDGKSGRPDLKGRVLVGHDSYNQDYSSIGNTGGLSHVGLKTGELPEHTHTDSGHTHSVSLTSSYEGEHNHELLQIIEDEDDDLYEQSFDTWFDEREYDDNYYTRTYSTSTNGGHSHSISGQSHTNYASITKTGVY